MAGEESAAGALGGQLIAVAGAKGGVGTTTVALHLALAAARAAPGRPVCVVDFDLQKGDFRTLLDTPYRRSVVDLVEVADEISVRHLQETLYTHQDGFRVLLAPDEGERAEEVDAAVARSVLTRRQGAPRADRRRPRRHGVGGERDRRRDRQPRCSSSPRPTSLALRGVRRLRELWRRLQVREDDEDVLVVLNRASRRLEIQPDLARKVVGGRMAETTIPADFAALRGGGQHRARRPAWRTASCAARSRRCSTSSTRSRAGDEPDSDRPSRAACSPGWAASAARRTRRLRRACCRCCRDRARRSGRSA